MIIPSKFFVTGAAVGGIGTGGISTGFQYSPLYDSTFWYQGKAYDISGMNYGIGTIRSLIYVAFGHMKLPIPSEKVGCTAAAYPAVIWQMPIGSALPIDITQSFGTNVLKFYGKMANSYIFCEMRDNKNAVSSVQSALSFSELIGGAYDGIPIISQNTPKGLELLEESIIYANFAIKNLFAGGFDHLIKDKTHNPVAVYNRDTGEYIIGPFKVDYNRASAKTSRGKSEFGLMTDMRIYDQNGAEINRGYWEIIWEEGAKNGRDSINADDPYPNPNEEFYIKLINYYGNDIQAISKIECKYMEMQTLAQYNILAGEYLRFYFMTRAELKAELGYDPYSHTSVGYNIPVPFFVPHQAPRLLAVNYAKKYYRNHTQTIKLQRKQTTDSNGDPSGISIMGGYETAEFTTTSSVKKNGITNVSTAYGDPANSDLYNTIESITRNCGANKVSYGSVSKIAMLLQMTDKIFNAASLKDIANGGTGTTFGVEVWLDVLAQGLRIYGKGEWADWVGVAADWADGNVSLASKIESTVQVLYPGEDWVKYVSFAAAVADLDGRPSSGTRAFMMALKTFDVGGEFNEYFDVLGNAATVLQREKLTKDQEQRALGYVTKIMGNLIDYRTEKFGLSTEANRYNEFNVGYEAYKIDLINKLNESDALVKVATKNLIDYLDGQMMSTVNGSFDDKTLLIMTTLGIMGGNGTGEQKAKNIIKATNVPYGDQAIKVYDTVKKHSSKESKEKNNKKEDEKASDKKEGQNPNGNSAKIGVAVDATILANDKGVQNKYPNVLKDVYDALESGRISDALTAIEKTGVGGTKIEAAKALVNIIEKSKYTKEEQREILKDIKMSVKIAKQGDTGIQLAATNPIQGLNLQASSNQDDINKTIQRLVSYVQSSMEAQAILEEIDKVFETDDPFEATCIALEIAGVDGEYQSVGEEIKDLTSDLSLESKKYVVNLLYEISRRTQENGGNVANAMKDVIDYDVTVQPLRDMPNVLQGLKREEIQEFLSSLENVKDFSQLNSLFGTFEAKKTTRTLTPDEQNYLDTRTEGDTRDVISPYLVDDTPYIEYNPKFSITNAENPENVYWQHNEEGGLTVGVAGVVWKDAHWGTEEDYDGIRGANALGELEAGIPGVKVTVINSVTGEVAQRYGDRGERLPATTYTDDGGYYHIERIRLSEYLGASYDVEFEYDGQTYKTTKYLEGYGKEGTVSDKVNDYINDPDAEKYFNDSKALEDPEERQAFNDRYHEITEGYAISFDYARNTLVPCNNGSVRYDYRNATQTNGSQAFIYEYTDNTANAKLKTPLSYTKENGVSKLVTLDEEGHVLPQYAMHARTSTNSLTYPLYDVFMLDDSQQAINSANAQNQDMYLHFEGRDPMIAYSTGKYMYHINLGLVERSKADVAVTQDVYKIDTTVNEKQETYNYDQRGSLEIYNTLLRETDEYHDWSYTRELYKADYDFRKADYRMNDLNKLDRNQNDKTAEIANIVRVKNNVMDDISERVFVTYKIKAKNQSILQAATINELTDYYNDTYKFIGNEFVDSNGVKNNEGVKMYIQDNEGNRYNKLIVPKSYYEVYEVGTNNVVQTAQINWYEKQNKYSGFKTIYTPDIRDIILESGQQIVVYVTFEVTKGYNDALTLGEKRNIVEITNYSTFAKGSPSKIYPEGLIDKDSAPGHADPRNKDKTFEDKYEDNVDEAPYLELKLYDSAGTKDGRIIEGYVWDDARTKSIKAGPNKQWTQNIGNGLRELNLEKITNAKNSILKGKTLEDGENTINGVRVQLVEKIVDPQTGAEYEYVWKEMYTSEDEYRYVQNGGAGTAGSVQTGNISANQETGSSYEYNVIDKGQYRFSNYVAGNYIVRFIYGDDARTYLTNDEDKANGVSSEITKDNGGKNKVSYNGQDYKSTTYQLGSNVNRKWYDLADYNQMETLMSDAKDDETRRKAVMEYSRTIENDKAEVLASFDARSDRNSYEDKRNYYDESKHKELRDNTWMFADTAWFNVQVEYNKTEDSGIVSPTYKIKNIDFGLEERPETKMELNLEIISIKVTEPDKTVIIDTANGISKNVSQTPHKKEAQEGYTYKRKTKSYRYSQGTRTIFMDNEVLQGVNLEIKYKITITNNSEVDTLGADGSLGTAYYEGRYSKENVVVTTKIDKIIDYVDNSSTFRKDDSLEWSLIENMDEFLTDELKAKAEIISSVQTEAEKRALETYLNTQRKMFGEQYVNDRLEYFEKKYREEQIAKTNATVAINNTDGIRNQDILKNMQKTGYLNPSLEFVQTKSGKTINQRITQTIVTKDLEDDKMTPGDTKEVILTLSKTLTPNDDVDTYDYRNVAEILQYTNDAGRRDMDAIPGNQDPNVTESISWAFGGKEKVMPAEYDSDVSERIIILPPFGDNRNAILYTIIASVTLVVLAGVIIIVRKKVLPKKK